MSCLLTPPQYTSKQDRENRKKQSPLDCPELAAAALPKLTFQPLMQPRKTKACLVTAKEDKMKEHQTSAECLVSMVWQWFCYIYHLMSFL
ncbi:hypothetical protein MUK42_37562 [Musa troglodytarum]|uniref:Uncharacterized protein n=1 Tax=Musa troglodytarum TaxID=320322 RepID=A0A9E7GS27_9LILI|nr:hypothetical protein MUK42_37562 [Musa troglodytarum]